LSPGSDPFSISDRRRKQDVTGIERMKDGHRHGAFRSIAYNATISWGSGPALPFAKANAYGTSTTMKDFMPSDG
jgi:hypothetical protein